MRHNRIGKALDPARRQSGHLDPIVGAVGSESCGSDDVQQNAGGNHGE